MDDEILVAVRTRGGSNTASRATPVDGRDDRAKPHVLAAFLLPLEVGLDREL